MILEIPKHRHSRTYWTSTILVLFIIITFLLVQGYLLHPEPSDDVRKMAVVSGRVMVIRFPPTLSEPQEIIIVHEDDAVMTTPRQALRGPAHDTLGFSSNVNKVQLTPSQWVKIDTLRDQWCNIALLKMPFQQNPEDEPYFDIGISCGRQLKIPFQYLPPELKELIETIPSPGCDEPFCGWKDKAFIVYVDMGVTVLWDTLNCVSVRSCSFVCHALNSARLASR